MERATITISGIRFQEILMDRNGGFNMNQWLYFTDSNDHGVSWKKLSDKVLQGKFGIWSSRWKYPSKKLK